MTLTGKAITGVATTGLIGGISVGSYYAFSNSQTINGRLQKEGFEPLDISKSGQEWTTVLNAYKLAKNNIFENSTATTETEKNLKELCKKALNSTSDNFKNYLLAKQWCVKEKKAKDIFEKLELRVLAIDPIRDTGGASSNPDDNHWTKKLEKYNNKQSKTKIEITTNPPNQNATIESIKNACKTLDIENLKTTTDGFNEKIEKAQEWCTVSKDAK